MTPEIQGGSAGLVARAKRIIVEPKAEWDVIDAEPATVQGVFTGWAVPLAAIPPVASMIGMLVFGVGFWFVHYRPSIGSAIATAVTQYIVALVSVFVLALVIDALAPSFGGTKSPVQAMKVAAYSMTAAWLAGIFGIIPTLGFLGLIGLYSFYLLYLGLPKLMKVSPDKEVGYVAAVIVVAIVLYFVAAAVAGAVMGAFIHPAGPGTISITGT